MTVVASENINRINYTGNGATTIFSFPHYFEDQTYLSVYLTVVSTGVATLQTLGLHYSVTGAGDAAGGSVTMVTAPTALQRLTIVRDDPIQQPTAAPFTNLSFGAAVDRIVREITRVWDLLTRTPRLRNGDLDGSGAYDANGNRITNLGSPTENTDAVTLAYMVAAYAALPAGATGPTGPQGPTGATGAASTVPGPAGATGAAAGFAYTWATSVAATDPGAGVVKGNNAALASITAIYISETDANANAIAAEIATWDDSTSTIRGRLLIYNPATPANVAIFNVTGANTDNGAWDTVNVSFVASNGAFAAADALRILFIPKGDKGDTGAAGAAGTNGTNGLDYTADAELNAIAGLVSAADRLPYFTGVGAAALATFSAFARTFVDDADAATVRTTLGLAIGSNVQAWDADLDALAALAGTGILNRTGAATFTQLTAPAGTIVGTTDTQTVTNKRVTKRVTTEASNATPTPNVDNCDMHTVTAQAAAAAFGNPAGTPTEGQPLVIRIKDNGTARALTWGANYRTTGDISLPTTTVISKTMYLGFIYNNTDTKWDLVAKVDNI